MCLWQCIKINHETKIFETGIETLYETKSFKSITCISLENDISIARTFFATKIFETDTETFFETKIFETDTETFFETKVFETDTETFFRDQIFSRPIPRLFFETKYFRDRDRYSQKIEKSLDTEKSRDEMSHSAVDPSVSIRRGRMG